MFIIKQVPSLALLPIVFTVWSAQRINMLTCMNFIQFCDK